MPFVTRNGVRISYEIEGEGPPVVATPGLGGNLKMVRVAGWRGAFPHHQLILVDPRGHGKSDRPKDPKGHRIEEYRDDVLAVLDAVHAEKVVCWGFSDGSYVCCALADAYPQRVCGLIDHDGFDDRNLCDSPVREGRVDLARKVRAGGWSAAIRALAASTDIRDAPALVKEFLAADPEMVALELEEWTHWNGPVSVLPRLKIPILSLQSGDTVRDKLGRMQRTLGGMCELHVIPGVSHWQICFDPGLTLALVRNFLDGVQR